MIQFFWCVMMNSLEALNICLVYQKVNHDFHASNQNGPRRSIVRRIASRLPLAPVKRFCLHLELIKLRNRSDGGVSSSLEGDLPWRTPGLVTIADVPKLIHEKSPPGIRLRCEHRSSLSPSATFTDSEGNAVKLNLTKPPSQMSGTAAKRIMELEIELAKLRQRLAEIVRLQEQGVAAVDFTSLSHGMTPSFLSCESAGGHPPLPPPPPPFPVTPATSVTEIIRKNKAKSSTRCSISGNRPNVNMTEILKDMGKVKLRQIARSPGGTPLKQAMNSRESNDLASFITNALKKKFAKVKEEGKENQSFSSPDDSSNSSSPITTNSPISSGPHLVKSRRHLQLKPMLNLGQLEVVAE